MGYNGQLAAPYTVFPTTGSGRSGSKGNSGGSGKAAPYGRTASGSIRSKPCAFGPSPTRGNCPKKASTARGRGKAAGEQILQAVTGKPVRRNSAAGKIAGAVGAAVGAGGGRVLRTSVAKKIGGGAASTVLGALGSKAKVAGVTLAGLASYYITSRILENRAIDREDRASAAHAAATAYRDARLELERQKKAPLTAREQVQLAETFKAQLRALGLETTNLKPISGRSAYYRGAPPPSFGG